MPLLTNRIEGDHAMQRRTSLRALAGIWTVLSILGCSQSSSDGGGGGGGGGGAPGTSLGDLAKEVDYALTSGAGTVFVQYDASLSDVAFSSIVNGQRLITLNPIALPTFSLNLQNFFTFHEFGHHYSDHHHKYTACKYAEYEAGAYGARVLYDQYGAGAVQEVSQWFLFGGSPGDPTHRTGVERSLYIDQVLAAVQIDPTQVPEPPTPVCSPAVYGQLYVYNPFTEAVSIFVGGSYGGDLGPAKGTYFTLYPGTHLVEFIGYYTYYYAYWPVVVGELTVP